MTSIKDKISIITNIILIICALVITGLWGQRTFMNFSKMSVNKNEQNSYKLPAKFDGNGIENIEEIKKFIFTKNIINGFPLAAEFASIVKIAGRKMILIPIIMDEPVIKDKVNYKLVNPLKWNEKDKYYNFLAGRRSIWFMPKDTLMLYAIILDPRLDEDKVGIGFVLVKRIDEYIYDVLLQTTDGKILFAARGQLDKLNPDIGRGTLIPVDDQTQVRQYYSASWDISPYDFILFCKSCEKDRGDNL